MYPTFGIPLEIGCICKTPVFRIGEVEFRITIEKMKKQDWMSAHVTFGLLFGIPKYQTEKLQGIQNAAARVVCGLRKYDHVSPTLRELHWLPIEQRIKYKILLLTYKSLNDKAPGYLKELLTITNNSRNLRSNNKLLLELPKCKLVWL